ncbi:unnamed protein product, partial [Staurois parvus]
METNRYNVSTTVNVKELSENCQKSRSSLQGHFLPAVEGMKIGGSGKFDSCIRSLLIFGFDTNRIFPNIRNEFHFA